jgi:hypothetical protein
VEVGCQVHTPTVLIPGKENPIAFGQEDWWALNLGLTFYLKKTLFYLPEIEMPFLGESSTETVKCTD